MLPVGEEELKQLIIEAEAEGKKVDELRNLLVAMRKQLPPKAETKRIPTQNGTTIIESTGPARREDFEL